MRGEDMSFRDVKINISDRTWGCEWRHATEACAEDLGGFEKSQSWVESCRPKKGDFRELAEALCRVRTRFGADGKASIERFCLFPYVEKPNLLKGNKKFRTWTKKS